MKVFMTQKPPDFQPAQFVKNGLPDGFNVRLANMEVKHFPTATRMEETADGGIEIATIFLSSTDPLFLPTVNQSFCFWRLDPLTTWASKRSAAKKTRVVKILVVAQILLNKADSSF